MRNPLIHRMGVDLPKVLAVSSSRLLNDPLQHSSLPGRLPLPASPTILTRIVVFRATMLVIALLLLLLFSIACWDSILRCFFCLRFFAPRPPPPPPRPPHRLQLPRGETQKAWSVLAMVPVVRYGSARGEECKDSAMAESECTICLNEHCEGDLIRILPKCRHYFHVQCIDPWLVCHLSCPICRKIINESGA